MAEEMHYRPIGTLYQVSFQDNVGYSWEHNVLVPYGAGVEEALRVLERAYPGRVVTELKRLCDVHHGHVGTQQYLRRSPPNRSGSLRRRTRAEVIAARATVVGCCEHHADNMACSCLEEAE